ncbi:mCG1042508, partial [Mus musculus]
THSVHKWKLLVYTTCFKTKLACAAGGIHTTQKHCLSYDTNGFCVVLHKPL